MKFKITVLFVACFLFAAMLCSQEILDNKVKFKETKTTIRLNKKEQCLVFNKELHYWIFASEGNIVKKGVGTQAIISNLNAGFYYLCLTQPEMNIDSDGDGKTDEVIYGLDLKNLPKYTCKFYVDWTVQ